MFISLKKLFAKTQPIQDKVHRFLRPESDEDVKRLQYFWVICGGIGFLVLSYGLVSFLYTNPLQSQEKPKPESVHIESALSKVDVHDTWRHKIEDSLDRLSQKTDALEKLLTEGIKRESMGQRERGEPDLSEEEALESSLMSPPSGGSSAISPLAEGNNHQNPQSPLIQGLDARLSQLEMQVGTQKPSELSGSFHAPQGTDSQQETSLIHKVTLGLSEGPHSKQPRIPENTIPAGAFAKTVLLSGLDASSAMNAASDPRPMLLRIIDYGTLPRRFQSDLKDCHCTAGAYGDLSSERVYARLEKLTCIERESGKIIETQVAGYVAGSDGKAGIRGIVASKDGQFLARSLMGGLFSGLSNVANPQNRQAQVNPFFAQGTGAKVAGPSMGEMFTSGMAGGATSALDRLSQYYIDRAEQLQPVIQIAAGQVVDIVFTEGTFIGSPSREQSSDISNQQNKENKNNEKP